MASSSPSQLPSHESKQSSTALITAQVGSSSQDVPQTNPSASITKLKKDRLKRSKPNKRERYGTARALDTAYALACITGWIGAISIAQSLIKSYMMVLIYESRSQVLYTHIWYEVALCFGPRMPLNTLLDQVSLPQDQAALDNDESYRDLFLKAFKWSSDGKPIDLMAKPVKPLLSLLSNVTYLIKESNRVSIKYTDMSMLYTYSVCRNYSFAGTISEATHLKVTMTEDLAAVIIDGNISSYLDVYVYPSGEFSEFPIVSDYIPYRFDLQESRKLHVNVKLTNRVSHRQNQCKASLTRPREETPTGSQVNCLFWCMARHLLRNAKCQMPFMETFMYNMTAVILNNSSDSGDVYAKHRWKWIGNDIERVPCSNSADFNATMDLFAAMYLITDGPLHRYTRKCRSLCPPDCRLFNVRTISGGEAMKTHSHHQRYVQVRVPANVTVVEQGFGYQARVLVNHLLGLLAAMFSLSLFSLHDIVLAHLDRFFCWLGIVQPGLRPHPKDDPQPVDGLALTESEWASTLV